MVQQDFQNASNLFGENSRNNAVTNQLNLTSYSTTQNQGYLNSNISQTQRPAQNFNYYNPNFQYNNYVQTGAQSSQNAQANNMPNYTSLTNVANSLAKSSQFLRNFPNVYENINNNYNNTSTKNVKAAKSNSDGDNSKIYGNAFLGQNLWDKNDLFQSEKFGVKFECLEIDEFLNENGLNETDVEFLDQLHKFENSSTNQNSNNSNNNQSSTSSLSPKSSCISTPSSSPSINLDSNLMSSNMSMLHSNSSTSASSISSSSPSSNNQVSRANLNTQNVQFQNGNLKNKQDVFDERKSSSRNSFDWSLSMNDSSMDSISDYEDFSKAKKFNEDEMKTQPVSRKSKKFVPNELKDEKYWARRRKNNVAAKRSRDARRMKENQIALRASYLERENDLLRKQLEDFKRETKLLKTKLSRYESDVQIENPIK